VRKLTYSDKMGHRSRSSWALVIGPGDQVERFERKSIPGKLAVTGQEYEKAGKWSHTTYQLVLAPHVRFIPGHMGWETGTFNEGLAAATLMPTDRWHEVANALGVTQETAREFLQAWVPRAAKRLDKVESDLASLDNATEAGASTVAFSYGNPTRRERSEGFWEWPVRILDTHGKEVGQVSPEGDPSGDVKVLKRTQHSGHGGGSVSMLLAVPDGCRVEHGPEPEPEPEV